MRQEEEARLKAELEQEPETEEDNRVWKVTLHYPEGRSNTVEVWNEGPNAALGTVSDQMEKLLTGEIEKITLERAEWPRPFDHHPAS
jgi:hypothetical protein